MSWWTFVGGYIGFTLGGPLGALLGAVVGHQLSSTADRPNITQKNRAQTAFFTATFSVMGHICKADGKVTQDEIQIAEHVMSQMALSKEQKKAAGALFEAGKKDNFPLEEVLEQLQSELGISKNIKRVFLEIQCAAAYADNVLHPAEEKLLYTIAQHINFPKHELQSILAAMASAKNYSNSTQKMRLDDAYAILNIKPNADEKEIKRAYRKLMNQHHPDKLIAKGLPEEMIACATKKTQEIRAAYDRLKDHEKNQKK